MRPNLYERLTFTFHRVETALDFLVYHPSPIVDDIRDLQFSFNIRCFVEEYAEQSWHAHPNDWTRLRNGLAARAPQLRRLSVWLDAPDPHRKIDLTLGGPQDSLLAFDAPLLSVLRISVPDLVFDDRQYNAGEVSCVHRRGYQFVIFNPRPLPDLALVPEDATAVPVHELGWGPRGVTLERLALDMAVRRRAYLESSTVNRIVALSGTPRLPEPSQLHDRWEWQLYATLRRYPEIHYYFREQCRPIANQRLIYAPWREWIRQVFRKGWHPLGVSRLGLWGGQRSS